MGKLPVVKALRFARCAISAIAVCCAIGANAATVSPVLVELSPKQPVKTVRFQNDSDDVVVLQVQALNWLQENGLDIYNDATQLVVSPRIVRIPAHATQVFRIIERAPIGSAERAYRLILEDITSDADQAEQGGAQVKLRINHNLPVFGAPATAGRAMPFWSRCVAPVGKTCLRLENRGNKRIRIADVSINQGENKAQLKIVDAVLAGSWKEWVVDAGGIGQGASVIRYRTESGAASAEILQ